MYIEKITLVAVLGMTILTSCKKKNSETDTPIPSTGSVKIMIDNVVGNRDLQLNTEKYLNQHADTFSVSMYKYYLSNIQLTAVDNSVYTEKESYHLVDEGVNGSLQFTLAEVPQKNYSSITFTIGVDSLHNISGAQSGALDPIYGMFWTWNSGYVMAKIEGLHSKTALAFHIGGFAGTDKVLKTVTLPFPNTAIVSSSAVPSVKIKSDVLEWFKTPTKIDFGVTNNVAMPGANAKLIADNYADMFTITEVKN